MNYYKLNNENKNIESYQNIVKYINDFSELPFELQKNIKREIRKKLKKCKKKLSDYNQYVMHEKKKKFNETIKK